MRAFTRAAFIIRWWPAIVEKVKVSKLGDRWRLPLIWQNADHTKMETIKDPRIDGHKDENNTDTTKAKQVDLDLRPLVLPSGDQ
jgi:hypothetical protein